MVFDVMEWERNGVDVIGRKDLGNFKQVLVKANEAAVLLRDGKIYDLLPAGRHALTKLPVYGRLEVIWVDLGIVKNKFGFETLSSDNVKVGGFGMAMMKVADPKVFFMNVVAGKSVFTRGDLEKWMLEITQSVMRSVAADLSIRQVYLEREDFILQSRVRMKDLLREFGLEFVDLELAGVTIPTDVEESLKAPFKAGLEAEAIRNRFGGIADAYKMLVGTGVDPIKYEAVKALETWAGRPPAEGGAAISGDILMPLVFTGLLAKDSISSIVSQVSGSLGLEGDKTDALKSLLGDPEFRKLLKNRLGEDVARESTPRPDESTSPITPETLRHEIAEIDRKLAKLEERFALGEVRENVYSRVKKRMEQRKEDKEVVLAEQEL